MGVGERVALARNERGLTQAQLAGAVGLERSALAKIETGARRVSALELVNVARELGRRVEWFVEPGPPALASYRTSTIGMGTQVMDVELDRTVRDVEFVATHVGELLTGFPGARALPSTTTEAEQLAAEGRAMLGLAADEPAHDLARRVEAAGLLAFSFPLGDGADAGTVLLDAGGVAVINGDLQVGRRRLALAHEFGHYLVADPYTTDWRIDATDPDALEARVDRFARALLLPEGDLRTRWAQWSGRTDESMRDAAVRAGSHYRVDMGTLARRLGELGLADSATAGLVRSVRTKKSDIIEKNLVVHHELEPVALPRPYEQAVLGLYRREIVTASRAMGLLRETLDEDSLPDLPPAPEGEIWSLTS